MRSSQSISSEKAALVTPPDRIRAKEAARLAQVSTGTIYLWMHGKKFKTWNVKARGKERGIRYIDRSSFEAFLNSLCPVEGGSSL
jgi:Helix-turn-helix domain